ncbi:NACHT domain-containing protein [Streptomyces althioticus]|uniref:NACHT domain-containing protein n=1 Tax=Streptomyces althioticus TaxID=83380 RepID=UPI0034346B2C
MVEVVNAALGALARAAGDPIKDAALRKRWVIKTLKALRLDPNQPPQDFHSIYAYTMVEALHGKPSSVLGLFEDKYVQQSFYRSYSDDNWSRLQREMSEAVERNRETGEFGYLPHSVEEEAQVFIAKFQDIVSRSRTAYETRLENKLDNVSDMLDQVLKTRSEEEKHRQSEDPERAEASPSQRLASDIRDWFQAVGYTVRREWRVDGIEAVALLVEVPQRRRGKFDLVVSLCVDGELAPYHMQSLKSVMEKENAAEGWGIAQLRVSSLARDWADQSDETLSCFSFDELVDLEADFEPYIEWLEQEVRSRHIDSRYVPLTCHKEEVDPRTEKALGTSTYDWRNGGLDNYVDTWLADPAKKHLSLLGEFGMGKSWFALHLAGRLAAGWRDAKARKVARPRIPLVIPLRDYAKQTSVSALLSEFFFNKHRIDIRNYEVFSLLNRMGRFLLIFDGFDEMASRTDRNTMVANFWELAKVAEPGAKVLLSSRTEYFPEAKEARDLFAARVSTSVNVAPSEGPTFEIVELVPFDDEQIRLMLGHLLTPEKLEVVMTHEGVRDLMRRPVMSELVIDALPEIEQGAVINLARIYLYAIKRKMDRDVSSQRTFTSRADKLFFLCEVAWEMIRTNQLTLNYRDFPDRLRACFGPIVENSKDLDYWEQDMRNQSMLVRNSQGDYGPSHKSLLEFLTAFRFAAELGLLEGDFLRLIPGAEQEHGQHYSWSSYFSSRSGDGKLPSLASFEPETMDKLASNFGASEYNPVVFDFLASMVTECASYQDVLIKHITSTAGKQDTGSFGGNCANLLAQAKGTLEGVILDGSILDGLGLTGDGNFDISLSGASLAGANLSNTNIAFLNKRNANFEGAELRDSHFLLSPVTLEPSLFGSDGSVSALLVPRHGTGWPGRATAVHWPTGDITAKPLEFPLTRNHRAGYSRGISVLDLGDGLWAHSDASDTVVRSSLTGEVVRRVPVYASGSVPWGDSHALVQPDRARGNLVWYILDSVTGETLHVCTEKNLENDSTHRLWSYRAGNSGLLLRVGTELETAFFETTPDSRDWVELARYPVGTEHAVGHLSTFSVMATEDTVYVEGSSSHTPFLTFPKSGFGDSFKELASSHYVVATHDSNRLLVTNAGHFLMLEREKNTWRTVWTQAISASAVAPPQVSPKGDKALVGLETGELAIWSLSNGERLAAVSFNHTLKGARFSKDSNLDPWDYESIRLAGADVTE